MTSSYTACVRQRVLPCVKEYIASKRIYIKFVESYNYRVNTAEHSYKAIKYHTVATLCTVNPACLIQLWDRFMPKIEATLNIVRTSRIVSIKSVYEVLNGQKFGWNRTPLAPVGQQALTFIDQENRLAWAPHAINAYTL